MGWAFERTTHCENPTCSNGGDEGHHLFRKSDLKADYKWVYVVEIGKQVKNIAYLCNECHRRVTDNEVWISLGDDAIFRWHERDSSGEWDEGEALFGGHDTASEATPGEPCPTCKRKVPVPNAPNQPARKRTTWAIYVPKDEQENGAELLDTLLEQAAEKLVELGVTQGIDIPKYFVLVPVLYKFLADDRE